MAGVTTVGAYVGLCCVPSWLWLGEGQEWLHCATTRERRSGASTQTMRRACGRSLPGYHRRVSAFAGPGRELPDEQAECLANVDCQTRMALAVAREQFGEEEVIAVARYARMPGAEDGLTDAVIVVEDLYQGEELGTLLRIRLASYARAFDIRTLLATVHGNRRHSIILPLTVREFLVSQGS